MSWEKLVEEKIVEAMARGDFDELPGEGKPIDLNPYFSAPEDLRAAFSVLRTAGFQPEEVGLLQEIGQLKDRLAVCSDSDRADLIQTLQQKQMSLSLLLERRRRRRPVNRWRRQVFR